MEAGAATWLSCCSFFSAETANSTRLFYASLAIICAVYSVVALLAPLIRPECTLPPDTQHVEHPNPSFTPDPCRWVRYAVLLGLNPWEADMSCRVIVSIFMGSIIGFER